MDSPYYMGHIRLTLIIDREYCASFGAKGT